MPSPEIPSPEIASSLTTVRDQQYRFDPLTAGNGDEWDAFLRSQPYQNPFQSWQLVRALTGCPSYRPKGLVVRLVGSGDIVAGACGYRMVERSGLLSWLTNRVVVNGGPVVAPGHEAILAPLGEQLARLFEQAPVYTDIWCMSPQDDLASHYPASYRQVDHLNYFIDLSDGAEAAFAQFSAALRKTIRKNSKVVSIVPVEDDAGLSAFYDCLVATYARVGVPLIPKDVFERVFAAQAGVFLLAMSDDVPIACRTALRFGGELYDWYAGDLTSYRQLNANTLLVWHLLQYGADHGCKWFNFGGAGSPDKPYGPREFKKRFGGQLVNYGRFRHVNSPFKYWLLAAAIRGHGLVHRLTRGADGSP